VSEHDADVIKGLRQIRTQVPGELPVVDMSTRLSEKFLVKTVWHLLEAKCFMAKDRLTLFSVLGFVRVKNQYLVGEEDCVYQDP
jgi:hypothetical protein